jgi:hypothetical protein
MRRALFLVPMTLFVLAFPAFAGGKGKPAKPARGAPAAQEKKAPPDVKVKGAPSETASSAPADGAPPPTRGPTRIDFDDRLIQGQTNKSGAVYLYDRKELKTKSMIKTRDSFRDEIVGSLYDT